MNRAAAVASSALLALLFTPAMGCSAGSEPAPEQTSEAIAYPLPDGSSWVCAPSGARTAPGYSPAWSRPGIGEPIPGFSDELTALGCSPETDYHVGPGAYGELAVAYCPTTPPSPVWTIPADSCVGTPPPGWVVAVWRRTNALPPPPAGCHVTSCYEL